MSNLMHREPGRTTAAGPLRSFDDDTPRSGPADDVRSLLQQSVTGPVSGVHGSASIDTAALQAENADLRRRVEELEQVLLQSADSEEAAAAERHRELEGLLEQKSEIIRELHRKLQGTSAAEGAAPADNVSRDELSEWKQQLDEERRQIAAERQQLKEDEETLMKQMRDMELAAARDRAELARQRLEMQRLQEQLNREADQAARDGGLRERLGALRRGQEGMAPSPPPAPAPSSGPTAASEPAAAAAKKTGLFRRMFGG
jgi:hypothetical protein